MKTLIFACSVLLFTGCVIDHEPPPEDPPPEEAPILELAFVSAHFGGYWDCPDEAFGAAAMDAARSDADCDSEEGACGPLNCEPGQVTLQIDNVGDAAAEGIEIRAVEVLDAEGEVAATLPVLSVDTVEFDGFDGRVDAGETTIIRVEFQGPMTLRSLMGPGVHQAPLKVTLEPEDQAPTTLVTPAVESNPIIDT